MRDLLGLPAEMERLYDEAEREVIGTRHGLNGSGFGNVGHGLKSSADAVKVTAPATDTAKQWAGFGTSLKPSFESILLARKPLSEPTVAANCLRWGTGALAIDKCRVGYVDDSDKASATPQGKCVWKPGRLAGDMDGVTAQEGRRSPQTGRWPANLLHDGSDEVTALFPVTTSGGGQKSKAGKSISGQWREWEGRQDTHRYASDYTCEASSGSAARFFQACPPDDDVQRLFYAAKASKRDRSSDGTVNNTHPTCKPTSLMKYLVRLVTSPDGTVLDPFLGSGTTGVAAMLEGFNFIGIDNDEQYLEISRHRIEWAQEQVAQAQPMLDLA